jgi:hypothetical protein
LPGRAVYGSLQAAYLIKGPLRRQRSERITGRGERIDWTLRAVDRECHGERE